MKKSVLISIAILAVVILWMASGIMGGSTEPQPGTTKASKQLTRVNVERLHADRIAQEVVVQGQLAPLRSVELKAETDGLVVALPVEKGERVKLGQLLVELDQEDKPALLEKTQAMVASRQLEVEAAEKLKSQRLQTEQHLKSVTAMLAEAKAEQKRIELELKRTKITAPFAGAFEERDVEIGSLLQRGDPIGTLVDDSTMLAVGQVSQQNAAQLELGQDVEVKLLDGRSRVGQISYISKVAEAGTRSFKIEARFNNSDASMSAGYSAELRIQVGQRSAHFIPSSAITLSSSGVVGVKLVDRDNIVQFKPVTVVRSNIEGLWIDGLDTEVNLITQGQGFVIEGEEVEPVYASKSLSEDELSETKTGAEARVGGV